jgi:mannose-6-phosphate isomerase-like protein (cupin superfamily)
MTPYVLRGPKTLAVERTMKHPPAKPTVQIENDHIRVTEWRFAPGEATGYHTHEHDYVVVPVRTGELELVGPKGETSRAQLTAGVSYNRPAGVEHDVINAGSGEMVFIEIELKDTRIKQA